MQFASNYPDLRVKRTQESLRTALIELLQEMPYPSVNVSKIAGRAKVNRVTFYNHYRSKDELIEEIFELLLIEYASLLDKIKLVLPSTNQYKKAEKIISMYYQHFKEYSKIYKLLLSNDFPFYKDQFLDSLQESIRDSFSLITNNKHVHTNEDRFLMEWCIGGTVQILQVALRDDDFNHQNITSQILKIGENFNMFTKKEA